MIAIIPAREGSKGLPKKNILKLYNKPLIAYSIEVANSSKLISDVIVSTDSQEIYDIALEYGAKKSFLRPKHLATDDALAIDTYIYTIDRLEKELNINIAEFMILLPTSPLRTVEDIDESISLFYKNKADSVISYCEEHHPITWHKYVDENLKFKNIFPDTIKNRQDYEKSYYPNGSIYIFKKDIIKQKCYYSDNSFAYIMPRNKSVDIDTIEDFEYVRYIMKNREKPCKN